jgi:ABC-type transport system involved in cytochrome c biogenesis ATPase subunit
LDEPGAALDADGIALIDDLVREQAERGACILATNDPAERRYGNLELAIGT